MTYNQLNESNQLEDLSFEEVGRLAELGLLDEDILYIYNYVKNNQRTALDLANSTIINLPSWLKKVYRYLNIAGSSIEIIPDDLLIYGGIYASYSNLREFTISNVYGTLGISYTFIKKLPDSLSVNGHLYVKHTKLIELPVKLTVAKDLYIYDSLFEKLTNAELRSRYKIGGTIRRDA